jgi:hypothetical protein
MPPALGPASEQSADIAAGRGSQHSQRVEAALQAPDPPDGKWVSYWTLTRSGEAASVFPGAAMRRAADACARRGRHGLIMSAYATAPRQCSVSASFDGEQWDFFAIRLLPNRSWGVLHTHITTFDEDLDPRGADLLTGMPTRARARIEAARLAAAGFHRAAMSDRCRHRRPRPIPPEPVAPPSIDMSGDPARIGAIITAEQLAAPRGASDAA